MLPSISLLRLKLREIVSNKKAQGHDVEGLSEELDKLPDSYDALYAFALKAADLPMRPDWQYIEPNELEEIEAECDPARPRGRLEPPRIGDYSARAETALLGSVCGCMLGKPVEVNPTLAELRDALSAIGDWPLSDYISERIQGHIRLHGDYRETFRERIQWVAPDDDINYTLLGMLVLERHGIGFTKRQLKDVWLQNLPIPATWGPERTMLAKAGIASLAYGAEEPDWDFEVRTLNPGDELCGAMIRADAYGYACAGNPEMAARLAWRDASWTHRRTGIYGTMFAAAAIAAAFVERDSLQVFDTALKFVPQRSRFYQIVSDSLNEVGEATDWLDGYSRIHGKYAEYAHCTIYQESGTLINTLRFAESVGDGICKQVSQGNDTDSYGATAGSLLGAFFGPGHLEERWLAPFNDDLHTTLAAFYERSLQQVAKRAGQLPRLVAANSGESLG